ncbi:hypothetical protein GCM10009602_00210 [Nocardiopsis tropica]
MVVRVLALRAEHVVGEQGDDRRHVLGAGAVDDEGGGHGISSEDEGVRAPPNRYGSVRTMDNRVCPCAPPRDPPRGPSPVAVGRRRVVNYS